MAKTQKVKLTDLHVNTENYRFEPIASQKEAIDLMIDEQGEKLFTLASHIVEHGFNPNDKIQLCVSSIDPSKYNVLEGNRRIVALKLLNNPEILEGKNSVLKKKFKKLSEEHKADIPKIIECTVYDNAAEADKWIKLKHAGQSDGAGTVAWTSQQIQRFEEKVEGKSSIALQTIKILKDSPLVPTNIKDGLSDIKITNLDRLISDPEVREFIGINIHNGIIQSNVDEKEVIKGLTQIAKDLLDPKFKVNRIYLKEDRQNYLKTFPKSNKPNITVKAAKPWQVNNKLSTSAIPVKKVKVNPKDRDVLIPRNCILNIKNPKVNAIYHELQKLSVSKFTNAAAVSFRVFIELSFDCYIEENKLAKVTKDSRLIQKVTEVSLDMETKGYADKHICKGIRSSAGNKNDLLGIETWHAYVHNSKFSPTIPNLIITWDNIQPFIERLWENTK